MTAVEEKDAPVDELPIPSAVALFNKLRGYRRMKRKELCLLIELMAQDFVTLNDTHNKTATHYSWCPEYEDRQRTYSRRMKVFCLFSRSTQLPTAGEVISALPPQNGQHIL
jgi:hypothetical protein